MNIGNEYLEIPLKSENDTKEYRVIRLQNDLTALLIADTPSKIYAFQNNDQNKTTASSKHKTKNNNLNQDIDKQYNKENGDENTSEYDKDYGILPSKKIKKNTKTILINGYANVQAECGLCVGVGNFSDPPEIPGMAHFLEHMVFMGSEKYPHENYLRKFINKCGGYINAWTECEHTTFHFNVPEKHLLPTLDRFAQIFIKPLLKKEAIRHEREVVEKEFQLILTEDNNRKDHLLSTFAQAGHPAGKFIWGNLITLRDNVNDDKLYKELHKFKERHYSAHRMKLVIRASLSLDTLEKYVTMCFADVPNNKLPPDDFIKFEGGISFNTPSFRKIYKIKSIKDINELQITWPMPSIFDFNKSKPHHFIMRFIGCAQKGSLNSYLRKKMWSMLGICNYNDHDFEKNSMYALLKLTLQLTDEGQEHFEEVLDAIFSFINFLKMLDTQKKIYDERFNPNYNNFMVIGNSTLYVKDLCKTMHHYLPRDYIIAKEIYQYDPEALQTCLNYLKPENANIMILSRKFNVELNKVEPWFKINYTDVEIPQEWIERWKNIEPLPDFHLPLSNPYITSQFTLMPMPADIPKFPVKIHSDTISEIWFRPNPQQSTCFMYFHFISSITLQSLKNAVLTRLYCTALQHLLAEEICSAVMAKFHVEFLVTERGIEIKLQGYKEKLMLLLFTIIKHMVDYPNLITKELFEVSKRQELGMLYNTFIVPRNLIWDVKMHIIKLVHYTYIDMYTALRNVNFDEFQNFIKSFNNYFYIQCLAQGNLTPHVFENVRECIKLINCKPLPNMPPQIRVMQLPLGTHYCCKLRNMNRIDVNSIVSKYYQVGVATIQLTVLFDLLLNIMMEPLFYQLRIKEQLGYDINCYNVNFYGILGYCIIANTQADKYTTEHVDQRIENFMKLFSNILEELSEKDLDDIKETLKKTKQCNLDLHQEITRNWYEITKGLYMFDRFEREVLALNDIKLNEFKEWFAKYMLNENNTRKLSIHIVGRNLKENTDDKAINIKEDCNITQYSLEYMTEQTKEMQDYHITNVENYKKNLYIYPISEGSYLSQC